MPREVWLISAVAFVNRAGTMVLPFLALYLTKQLQYRPAEAGALLAAFGLGALAGAYGGGWAADRFGAPRIMALTLVGQGLGFVLIPWADRGLPLAAILFLTGLLGEGFRPATSTALMLAARPELRARSFAVLRLAINLGMSVGPAAGGILAAHSYRWLFWIDGLTCLAAAVFLRLLHLHKSGTKHGSSPASTPATRSPWSDRPFLALVLAQFLIMLVFFQLLGSYPLILESVYHLDERGIGFTLAINTVLIALFELIIVQRLSHARAIRVAALGALLIGLGMGATPFASLLGATGLVLTVVIWTAGEILHMPFMASLTAERAGNRMGGYLGVLNLGFSSAFVLAPLLGGWLLEHHGPRAVGWICGAMGALAGIFLLRLEGPLALTSATERHG